MDRIVTRPQPSPPPGAEREGPAQREGEVGAHAAGASWPMAALRLLVLLVPALLFAAPAARSHAFLDHASPAVGSTVRQAPAAISIWFTQELEPAFSTITITDQGGQRVNAGDAQVDARDQTLLRASLKPLPRGTYKVSWHVVSVDTHTTEGTFTFRVAG
jgi:copper resistance protein C